MFVRFSKFFVVFSLIATLGAQWVLLQTVAWTTMFADNLHSGSFHDAVTKTFDGKHPCCLCKAIAAGKQSEKRTEFLFQAQKLEFPLLKENLVLIAPSHFEILRPTKIFFPEAFPQKPLTPPPRPFFV